MLKQSRFLLLCMFVFSVLVLAACNNSKADESGEVTDDYYKGKTIEMVVPFDAGGGSDVLARYFAPYFGKHMKGEPTTQVTNIPGAGSVIGANEYTSMRDADGFSTLWTSGSTAINYLLQTDGVKYDYKDFAPILGIPVGGVVYTSPSTGIKEGKDLLHAKEPLVNSAQSATGLDLITLISFEVLGADIQSVLGYEGNGPARVAFEQGESNINMQTSPAFLSNVMPLVDAGEAIPLYALGQIDKNGELVRDPAFPDIPTVKEVYEDIHGEEPSGDSWEAYKVFVAAGYSMQKVLWIQNDAPEGAIEMLREGAEEVAKNQEFIDKGDEVLGGYEPVVGKDLVEQIENTIHADIDDSVMEWVHTFLKEKYDEEV